MSINELLHVSHCYVKIIRPSCTELSPLFANNRYQQPLRKAEAIQDSECQVIWQAAQNVRVWKTSTRPADFAYDNCSLLACNQLNRTLMRSSDQHVKLGSCIQNLMLQLSWYSTVTTTTDTMIDTQSLSLSPECSISTTAIP